VRRKKEVWFIPEYIPQNTPFMMGIIKFVVQEWPKLGLGNKVHQYFTWFEKDLGKMCYVRREFDAEARYLSGKMLNDPDWAIRAIAGIEKTSKLFFGTARRFRNLPFRKMSNPQMIAAWRRPMRWHLLSHGVGASVSWHADANGERVTKALLKIIESRVKARKLDSEPAVIFSLLSSPTKESALKKEEKGLLYLAAKKAGRKQLAAHARKYEWLNYQYKGPAFDFQYFENRFGALKPAQANRILKEMETRDIETEKRKKKILKSLELDSYELKLIRMAQEMVFIKDFRKEALYHGTYCYEPFFREVGRRFSLSLDQVRAMDYWEIVEALKTRKVDVDELNRRLEFVVVFATPASLNYYTGNSGKNILKKITWEKTRQKRSNEFTGTCAYPGKVRGKVRIINVPEDMVKMKKGDILVAHNTNPNLVLAMKLAGALVSGAGGLTCHTAIVARELRTPSIVGIAGIDKILKDGDRVEVDANRGIVRRI